MCLRSKPRFCFRENQSKEKGPFLKVTLSGTLFVIPHGGKNFRE